ncbi:hypothetical protein JCGZ_16204 [Jatropha curcas]|uniref:DUF3741 domain-containing protein n=1 Tax=Jatropha curcas TaxID=180498 RepID=A0A067KFM8_JATCU|nr:uncharacterized protein LOC105641007 [Jatropha curcas]KDP30639.1 hypothetical protein JCGZ_16204 [Jatropha curcas]
MKDLSFFLIKNSVGAKMRKGIRNFCNGDGSTSTLNQHKPNHVDDGGDRACFINSTPCFNSNATPPTLEEMILQLEVEEEIARTAKLNHEMRSRRMSCVNNSDILRSARNALNQYPRFSLDGKDAMYRSSFRNLDHHQQVIAGRKSICCERGLLRNEKSLSSHNKSCSTLAGESVVWCKPGVIAKLMGLEAMPVPVNRERNNNKETLNSILKRQNLRRRVERHEMERRLASGHHRQVMNNRGRVMGSCSRTSNGYCVMKPIAVEKPNEEGGWPTRRFR